MSDALTLESLIDACQATVRRCFDCLDAAPEASQLGETVLSDATDAFEGLEELLNVLDAVDLELRAKRTEEPSSATDRERLLRDSRALERAVELLARSEGAGIGAALHEVTRQGRTIYRNAFPLLSACIRELQRTSGPDGERYACLLDVLEPNPFGG